MYAPFGTGDEGRHKALLHEVKDRQAVGERNAGCESYPAPHRRRELILGLIALALLVFMALLLLRAV